MTGKGQDFFAKFVNYAKTLWVQLRQPRLEPCEIPLEGSMIGRKADEALHDREPMPIACQRIFPLVLLRSDKPDTLQRQCEIMLPRGVAGVGLGQALFDGERGAVALERPRQVALRVKHVADLFLRHGEGSVEGTCKNRSQGHWSCGSDALDDLADDAPAGLATKLDSFLFARDPSFYRAFPRAAWGLAESLAAVKDPSRCGARMAGL